MTNKIILIIVGVLVLIGIGTLVLISKNSNGTETNIDSKNQTENLTITDVKIAEEDAVYITLSSGQRREIAKFVPFQNSNFNEVRSYQSYKISPNNQLVAIEGYTFEDRITEIYDVKTDTLHEVIYGQIDSWTQDGLLKITSCNLAGEQCTDKISVSADIPWELKNVSSKEYTPISYRIFDSLFSIEIPADAVALPFLDDNRVTIKYVGQNSGQGTEITDGYFISIDGFKNATSEDYIGSADRVTQVQRIKVSGYDGMTYQTESEMGQNQRIEHVVFVVENGTVIDASYSVMGENKETYRDAVWEILNSLNFN